MNHFFTYQLRLHKFSALTTRPKALSPFPRRSCRLRQSLLAVLALTCGTGNAIGDDADSSRAPVYELTDYVVYASPSLAAGAEIDLRPETRSEPALDTAALLRGVPGANFNDNGPLSGQAQYRGMFGARIDTRIDGMSLVPGGPNWMDAPLHYAERMQLESLTIQRGIAPVSAGAEAPGGVIEAKTRTSAFTEGDDFETSGRMSSAFRSNGDGIAAGAFVGAGNRSHRFHVLGDILEGSDREFQTDDNRTVDASEYSKVQYGFGYAFRAGAHELAFDYRRHETDDTGNPSLPADIDFIDTDLFKGKYTGEIGEYTVEGQAFYQDVSHVMTNYKLRPAPDFFTPPAGAPMMVQMAFGGTDRRAIDAAGETLGTEAAVRRSFFAGELALGAEFLGSEHNADVSDPDSMFFTTAFNNVERERYSAFAEWSGPLGDAWHLVLGGRLGEVRSDAGRVTPPGLPPAIALATAFNAADRDKSDTLADWALLLRRDLDEAWSIRFGLSRKTRAPTYIERYAWLPIESTAGLADGNNHVGNLDLDPEVAHEVELGFDWERDGAYFTPRVFYRDVDDYIQGTPATDGPTVMVSTANGDPSPLRYNNVGAEFYGADAGFGYRFDASWRIDGSLSYVRAKRTDVDDDIFRVAPLNGSFALTYSLERWRFRAETLWAADQDKVSGENGEPKSDGYAVLNLLAEVEVNENLRVSAGIDNVFDTHYRDHLAGFNRVIGSDIGGPTAPPATERNRIPGTGRNFTLRMEYAW